MRRIAAPFSAASERRTRAFISGCCDWEEGVMAEANLDPATDVNPDLEIVP
jgi:hypothetical protein